MLNFYGLQELYAILYVTTAAARGLQSGDAAASKALGTPHGLGMLPQLALLKNSFPAACQSGVG